MANQPPPPAPGRPLFRLFSQAGRLEPQHQQPVPRPLRVPTFPGVSPLLGPVVVSMPTAPSQAQDQQQQPEQTAQVLAPVLVSVPAVQLPAQTQPAREPTPPPPQPETPRHAAPPSPSQQTASPRARESPRVMKSFNPTPPQSPKPSPRTQMMPNPEPEPKEVEQPPKSIYMQENQSNNHNNKFYNHNHNTNNANIKDSYATNTISENKEQKGDSSKVSSWNKPHNSASKTSSDQDEGMRVITIAGENMGALMELGPRQNSGRKLHGDHLFHSSKHQTEEMEINGSEAEKHNKGAKGKAKMKPMSAIVNSNVQGVNNSLLLGSACTHNNPGVHITLSGNRRHKPKDHDDDDHKMHR